MSGARKQKRLDAVKHPPTEDRLQGKEEEPGKKAWRDLSDTKMPLKNGGEMELGCAHSMEEWVRSLLERDPEHYQALRALVEGRHEEVSVQHIRDLHDWGFLVSDRTPIPGVQAIMEAAHRDTPDGPTLVDPLAVRTPEAAELVQEYDDKYERRKLKATKHLLRKLFDQDDGPRR
jgi:hypothetical protein